MDMERAPGATDTSTDETRWTAVRLRERRADGAFVYAVRSTGIFCRPSCPSRRPRRDRVQFFDDARAAERAGFRACKRCLGAPPRPIVEQTCARLRAAIDTDAPPPTLAALAAQADVSPAWLHRSFVRAMGATPRTYLASLRAEALKTHLARDPSVTAAGYASGFGSSRGVYESAAAHLGMTPGAWKRGGRGVAIDYGLVQVDRALGWLLVARTARGVCAVRLGERATLEADLRRELAAATLRRDDAGLAPLAAQIVASIARRPAPDLPLDLRATAFQLRVWSALRAIAPGTTRTYTEIARAIDAPSAVRAVARACASNPVALVVPCHRVVREDGALAGYRWGLERKRVLLDRESERGEPRNDDGRSPSGGGRPSPAPRKFAGSRRSARVPG